MQVEVTKITGIRGTGIKLLEEDKGNLFIKFYSTELKPYKYLYWMANEHTILATHNNYDHNSDLEKLY